MAGRIMGDLDRTGQTVGYADAIIAAIALNNGVALVTSNTDHYQRIVDLGYDLKLANWRE